MFMFIESFFLSQFFAGSAITGLSILRGKKEFTGLKAHREETACYHNKKKKKETFYTQQLWGKTLAPTIQLKREVVKPASCHDFHLSSI